MTHFQETAELSYTGSGDEFNITLNRGETQKIKEIWVYSAKAVANSKVRVFDFASALSANQLDKTNAASDAVFRGEFFVSNMSNIKLPIQQTFQTGLRLVLDNFGTIAHTVYVTVLYNSEGNV